MTNRPSASQKSNVGRSEPLACRPWKAALPPQKILAIRLQALGDTVITLPYLQSLNARLPSTEIDFLTREEFADIPKNLTTFRHVYMIGGGQSPALQLASAVRLLPRLRAEGYDVVLDLQRNRVSRLVRFLLSPKSFAEFDRFSPATAGERTRRAIESLRLPSIGDGIVAVSVKDGLRGERILKDAGADESNDLIVLNPAGSFVTKSWPLGNYVRFAQLWREGVSADAQFLILGLESLAPKGNFLREHLGKGVINLAGKTSASEALNILRKTRLVLTEDSGLMHMAWVAGVPTLALFGSSLSAWSRPLGKASTCLSSADLECGECLEPICKWGDVRCLTRYSPEFVVDQARRLLRV